MILVLNEWIFHDLLGENGKDIQRETVAFLRDLYTSRDKLVLPREARWMEKASRLTSQVDARLRNISLQFYSLMLDGSRTVDTRLLTRRDIPEELQTYAPAEDIYLIEAYMASDADCLVTTDQGLYDTLAGSELVSCRLRGEFLAEYHPG